MYTTIFIFNILAFLYTLYADNIWALYNGTQSKIAMNQAYENSAAAFADYAKVIGPAKHTTGLIIIIFSLIAIIYMLVAKNEGVNTIVRGLNLVASSILAILFLFALAFMSSSYMIG